MRQTLPAETLEFWMRWVDDCDTARFRRLYGFPPKTARRSQDPVIAYAAAQGKVLYRVSAESHTIYYPLSAQEWANWHKTSVSTARKAMILLFIAGDDETTVKEILRATNGRYDEPDGGKGAVGRKARSLEALWRKQVPAPRQVTDREWREALTTAFENAEAWTTVAEEWESIWRKASERAETWESISRMADERADQQQTAAEKWKAIAEKWEETWRMADERADQQQNDAGRLRLEIEKYRNALFELGVDPDDLAALPGPMALAKVGI